MTTRVSNETASAMLALMKLVEAICLVRPDGRELRASLSQGTCRVVFDEREAFITVGVAGPNPGDAVQWLETVSADPHNEREFGVLESARLREMGGGTTH